VKRLNLLFDGESAAGFRFRLQQARRRQAEVGAAAAWVALPQGFVVDCDPTTARTGGLIAEWKCPVGVPAAAAASQLPCNTVFCKLHPISPHDIFNW
jgi:hypothetical protein